LKNLVIIGAGGYGREAFTLAKNSIGFGKTFTVKGYLDNNLEVLDNYQNYPLVLAAVEDYTIDADDVFICAIGDIEIRQKTVKQILSRGGEFINLIHKSAYIGDGVKLGMGVFIAFDVVVSNDTIIGDFVLINSRALIGHDTRIGDFSSIGVYSFTGGGVLIGKQTSIGANASVMNNITIGKSATVGIGSVVIKNVSDNATVFGNPAKKVF